MPLIKEHIAEVRKHIPEGVQLVCVSKFHPLESIQEAYEAGERDFGESRVQEMVAKAEALPKDIRWHMIGHLQTNKVRPIIGFVHLIHSVDSRHLLEAIEREAARIERPVRVLLEVHVAQEQSKSGFSKEELTALLRDITDGQLRLEYTQIVGIMAMASHTDDTDEIRRCFREAKQLTTPGMICSYGMSDDYAIAIEEGSTMVRIGTTIFGEREY